MVTFYSGEVSMALSGPPPQSSFSTIQEKLRGEESEGPGTELPGEEELGEESGGPGIALPPEEEFSCLSSLCLSFSACQTG